MTTSSILNALIYIRVSDEDQVKGFSLAAQEREIRAWCAKENLHITETFRDEARTAKAVAGRRGLLAAMAYIDSHPDTIDAFVVWNTDRFARNALDHLTVREALAANGVRLLSVTENFDDSPSGRLFETIKAALNQFDNEERAKKTRTGMEEASRQGFWMHKTPLGYLSTRDGAGKRRLTPDRDRADLIARAFRLVASGTPKADALRQVTEAGLRDERGGRLTPQRFARMLACTVYGGWMETSMSGGQVPGEWPALVDRNTWHMANGILSAGRGVAHKTRRDEFPLKGLIHCTCGRPLTACWSKGKKGKKYPYYKCPKCRGQNISREKLEDIFCEVLAGIKFPQGAVNLIRKTVIEEFEKINGQSTAERDRWERERKKFESKKGRLLQLLLDGTIDDGDYKRQNRELQKLLAEASGRICAASDAVQLSRADLDYALSVLFEPVEFWRHSVYEGKIAFQNLIFEAPLTWSKEDGVRTPLINRAVNDLRQLDGSSHQMAAPSCIGSNIVAFLAELATLPRAA